MYRNYVLKVRTNVQSNKQTNKHTYILTCIHTYIHTCMPTYIHAYIHTSVLVCVRNNVHVLDCQALHTGEVSINQDSEYRMCYRKKLYRLFIILITRPRLYFIKQLTTICVVMYNRYLNKPQLFIYIYMVLESLDKAILLYQHNRYVCGIIVYRYQHYIKGRNPRGTV